MALVGSWGSVMWPVSKPAFGMIGTDMWNIFSNYGLTVIPMFILVGEFAHTEAIIIRFILRPTMVRPL